MHLLRPTALLLSLICSIANASARNDDVGRGHGGRPRVILYEHADFRGGSITLEPGQLLENLTRQRFSNGQEMNDRISSFRIEGDAELIVFHDAGFRGGTDRFTHSIANLNDSAPGWNDAISSVRVEIARGGRRHAPDRPDMGRIDAIIKRAYRDVLQRDADPGGLRGYRKHLIDDHWTEEQLRHSLRESQEFRELADRIVTTAYRELLNREPSPRERRAYRERMVRDRWSAEDVRKAIRRTDEFRMRNRRREG